MIDIECKFLKKIDKLIGYWQINIKDDSVANLFLQSLSFYSPKILYKLDLNDDFQLLVTLRCSTLTIIEIEQYITENY